MDKKDAAKVKDEFKSSLQGFVEGLKSYALTPDLQWSVKGFIDVFKNVYAISSDTKIVSKIIEIHLLPKVLEFAEKTGYAIVLTDFQNWYPDLSFVKKDDPTVKFAVDIKTTYRDPSHPGHCNGFTLGSHGKYFRDRSSKKNIQFPYSQYLAHLCIGIIYTRTDMSVDETQMIYGVKELGAQPNIKTGLEPTAQVDSLRSITSVVRDFQFFVCEKWEIASDRGGSGNTANIGSITDIGDILNYNGMFKNLGEEWFDDYWMNYGKITMRGRGGKSKKITSLGDFLRFRGKDATLVNPRSGKTRVRSK